MDEPTNFLPTLSGPYYTDPEIFAREQSRMFESQWVCTARCSDLTGPGAYQTFGVGSESIVVVRGRDEGLRAFFNLCRHRGSRLTSDATGSFKGSIVCPYHAWSYAFDGRLIGAPNLAEMTVADRDCSHLMEVASREWLGYLWVCLADQPPSFEAEVMAQVSERLASADGIDHYSMDELVVGRRTTYEVKANWKLIVENFMECYHCGTLHPELVSVLPEFRKGRATQSEPGHGAHFGDGIGGFTFDGREGFGRLPGLDDDQDRRYYGMTVKPHVVINLVPDHVIYHRIYPVTPDQTLVLCDWLFDRTIVESGANLGPSVELFHRVNMQDFGAVELTQPAMYSRQYSRGGVLVPAEHHMHDFHNWVRNLVGAPGQV